jgi:hypothetical protein
MDGMSLLGWAACAPDVEFGASLPFPAGGVDREAMPAMLRRRASPATQMAFSAAVRACAQASRMPGELPSVFASVAGEIQTSDALCIELARPDGIISPTAFHNSVQNTTAGYWSIAQGCTRPASALAAGADTFAMGLLEAWCQLACQGGELLLVCYDEAWPKHLVPGKGEPAFACALVLAAEASEGAIAQIGRPRHGTLAFPSTYLPLAEKMSVLAAIPLLNLVAVREKEARWVPVSSNVFGWQVEVSPALSPL